MRALFEPGSRLWLALFILSLAGATVLALLPYPPRLSTGEFADKLEHMLAFTVLSVLALLSFPAASRMVLWLILAALGAAIEAAQAIPGLNRDSTPGDLVADAAVAALVLGGASLLSRRPRRPASA